MTEQAKTLTETNRAIEIDETMLDAVSGGPTAVEYIALLGPIAQQPAIGIKTGGFVQKIG